MNDQPPHGNNPNEELAQRFGNIGQEWSRPRQMSVVLEAVGFSVPIRLHTSRFRSMLELLHNIGLEVCLADDLTYSPLGSDAVSPGMWAKLRLRRSGGEEEDEEDEEDEEESGPDATGEWSRPRPVRALFGQLGLPVPTELGQDQFSALVEALELKGFEVATSDGIRLTPLHDAVSIDAELRIRHDALSAPASLRHTTGGDRAELGSAAELGDYERALLRLELLTAGPSPTRATQQQLAQCVEVAAAGLDIQGVKQALLQRVGQALTGTQRDPLLVLTGLVRRLDVEDGEVLLREYAALHPEHDDLNELLLAHWAALCRSQR